MFSWQIRRPVTWSIKFWEKGDEPHNATEAPSIFLYVIRSLKLSKATRSSFFLTATQNRKKPPSAKKMNGQQKCEMVK